MANTHSLNLNGSSQYVYANACPININSAFTIEMWIKLNAEISSGTYQFLQLENNSTKWAAYMYYDYNGGTRRLQFKCSRWLLIGFAANYTLTLGTNNWTHLAYVRDTSSGQIWVNGEHISASDVSITGNNAGTTATSTIEMLGAGKTVGSSSGYNNYSNVLMDDVRIWNDVRTQQEIQDNMYSELTGGEAGLVSYWKMNNDLTATVGTSLTGVGTPTFSTDVPSVASAGGQKNYFFFM